MKKIKRLPLKSSTERVLQERTQKVIQHDNPASEALRIWDQRKPNRTAADVDISTTLGKMASGLKRCMYCEDSAGSAVEHLWPKSKYPCLAFTWDNYLLICSICNSNKGDQFPIQNGERLLIDPTTDDPAAHMRYGPIMGAFSQRDAKGAATIDTLKLNARVEFREGRKNTFEKLQILIEAYDKAKTQGRDNAVRRLSRAIQQEPFSAMLSWLLSIAQSRIRYHVSIACREAIQRCPELLDWV
jgi:uncharacterized protein (TIGR02646 family)